MDNRVPIMLSMAVMMQPTAYFKYCLNTYSLKCTEIDERKV